MWKKNRISFCFAGLLVAQEAAAHELSYRALLPRAKQPDAISAATMSASIDPVETQSLEPHISKAHYARDTTSLVDPLGLGAWEISRLGSIASEKLAAATAADTAGAFSYSIDPSPSPHLVTVPLSPAASPGITVDFTPTPLTSVSPNARPTSFDFNSFSSSLNAFSRTAGGSTGTTATLLVPSSSGLSVTLVSSTLTILPSSTSRSSTQTSSSETSSSKTSSSSSKTSVSPTSTTSRLGTSTAVPASSPSRLSDGAIAGIVVGSVSFLILLLALLAFCLRRRSERQRRRISANRVYPEEAYLYDPPMSNNPAGGAAGARGARNLGQPGMIRLPKTTAIAVGPLSNHPIPSASLGGIRPGGPIPPGTAYAPSERDALMGGMLGSGAITAAAAAATGRKGGRRRSYSGGPRGMQRQMEGRVFGSVPEEDEDSGDGEDLGTYRPNAALPQHDDSDPTELESGDPFVDPPAHARAEVDGSAGQPQQPQGQQPQQGQQQQQQQQNRDWPLRDSQVSGSDYSRDSVGVRSSMAMPPGTAFVPVQEGSDNEDEHANGHANGNANGHANGHANGSPKLRTIRNSFSFDRGVVDQI